MKESSGGKIFGERKEARIFKKRGMEKEKKSEGGSGKVGKKFGGRK